MANVTTTLFADSVQKLFLADYDMAVAGKQIWNQAPKKRIAMGAKRGSSVEWPMYERLPAQINTLDQQADVTPIVSSDSAINISISEYGAGVRGTAMLKATAYTDMHKVLAEQIADNYVDSVELLTRYQYLQGTNVYRYGNVARTSLTNATAEHLLGYNRLVEMSAQASSIPMPEAKGGGFIAILPNILLASIQKDTVWQTVNEYNQGKSEAGNIFNGEVGKLVDFRFVSSPRGKVYWGGATIAGASTTLSAAVAAGATTMVVASATSIAVGDWLLVGVKETAGTENVQVSAVASTTITIRGVGSTDNDTGFKYAHASGATVVEGQSAGAVVVVGEKSVGMVYSDLTGPNGKIQKSEPSLVIPGRFTDWSWWQLAGWKIIAEKYLLRGEFALAFELTGFSEELP